MIDALRTIVGPAGLVIGDDLRMRSCDPFRSVPPKGNVLVRPSTVSELAEVMRWCHTHGQRIVTHGGRTGVAGGAYADENELVLSLERMRCIEEIDEIGQVVIVQAGVTLEELHQAVAPHGLFYPIDLGAKGSATIGGNIATNAGGNRVIRWGMTRANVLGLEAVLMDGTIVSAMNRLVKNNTGYDLKHDFIGSEGTLGVVARAVLKLVPKPTTQHVLFASIPSFEAVLELLNLARRVPTLSAFEVMWRDYYAMMAASETGRRPVSPDHPFYVLVETLGYQERFDLDIFMNFVEEAYGLNLLAEAVCSTSQRQVDDFWKVREGAEVLKQKMHPFVTFDISVPIRRADAFVNDVRRQLGARYANLQAVSFGHLGDNNLHLGVHVGIDTLREEANIERCVYDIVKNYDGALTAEHGIGRFKRDFLADHVATGAMHMMRLKRASLDPSRLLNHEVLF